MASTVYDDPNPWDTGAGFTPTMGPPDDLDLDAERWSSPESDDDVTRTLATVTSGLENAVDALFGISERRARDRCTVGPDYAAGLNVFRAVRTEGIMVALNAAEAAVARVRGQPASYSKRDELADAEKRLNFVTQEFMAAQSSLMDCNTVDLVLTLTVLRRHRMLASPADQSGTDYLRLLLDRLWPAIEDRVRLCAWAVQWAEWREGDPAPDGKLSDERSTLARLDEESKEDLRPSAVIEAAASRSTDWDLRWNVDDTSAATPVGGDPPADGDLPGEDDDEPVTLDGIQPVSGDFRIAIGRLIAGDRAFRETDFATRSAQRLPALKVTERRKNRLIYQYNGITKASPSALDSPPTDDKRTEVYWDFARALWKELQSEGGVSALATGGGLTWGRGFLGPRLGVVVDDWVKACPDVGRALRLIGFVRSQAFKGQWIYVDVQGDGTSGGSVTLVPDEKLQKGTSLGMASKCVVRDLPVLYCLAEIGETMTGNVHQAFCDAQWTSLAKSQLLQFDSFASYARDNWKPDEWLYVAHALHWAFNTKEHFQDDYVGPEGARRSTMHRIYTTVSDARKLKKGWDRPKDCFEVNLEGSNTILSFGDGFIRRWLDRLNIVIDAIPEVPPHAAIYIVAKSDKTKTTYYELMPP